MAGRQPLDDITVLELASYISGPYAGKLMADLGARVIKIEDPREPDISRSIGPFLNDIPDPEKSAFFAAMNTNKRAITLNLRNPSGITMFRELIPHTHVLIEDCAPGYGITYAGLKEINHGLIMASVSGFGKEGPYNAYQSNDLIAMGMSGMQYQTGEPFRPPTRFGYSIGSYFSGSALAAATMLALFSRETTGKGQHIDVSTQESLAAVLEQTLESFLFGLGIRERVGGGERKIGALHVKYHYKTKDGMVNSLVANSQQFERLMTLMGKQELKDNPKYKPLFSPLEHFAARHSPPFKEEFDDLIEDWTKTKDTMEVFLTFEKNRINCCPVFDMEGVFNYSHLIERGFFVEQEHPELGKIKMPGSPYLLSKPFWQLKSPSPRLGQHNADIYGEVLGYSKEQLIRLKALGVI